MMGLQVDGNHTSSLFCHLAKRFCCWRARPRHPIKAKRLDEGDCSIGLRLVETRTPAESWYAGCFRRHLEPALTDVVGTGTLTDCSRKCDSQGFLYIAVNDDRCVCEKTLSHYESLPPTTCDLTCKSTPDTRLPCGGKELSGWSVYRADGPWVQDVQSAAAARWVEPGYPTTLLANITLRKFWNINLEPVLESEWSNTVELTWHSRPGVFLLLLPSAAEGVNISANKSQEVLAYSVTFRAPGTFPIGVCNACANWKMKLLGRNKCHPVLFAFVCQFVLIYASICTFVLLYLASMPEAIETSDGVNPQPEP
ncbi:hypothetical protein EGW08_009760 [Elysia chlorotica]|uniref:WSC domain-containing protein n=1 Tax=Elysia chlorotica TaxID=188477 RepID=A0A3S1BEZ0_ELYCH|nr:hypothetical protein EGW08_009760 [Elysia chlorotica]